jgi:hypothetical protein
LKIRVEIGDLILNGFDKHEARQISGSIESDLTKLIREIGIPNANNLRDRDIKNVDVGLIEPRHGNSNTKVIAGSIAKSIYNSLGGNTK